MLTVDQAAQDREPQRMTERGDGLRALGPVHGQEVLGGAGPLVLHVPRPDLDTARVDDGTRGRDLRLHRGEGPEWVLVGGRTGSGARGRSVGRRRGAGGIGR
ncbi:hypothetical protein [Brachybacterium sp. GPGPB12]|uniref:hypothetical protein n=1 Tax=Brachybacterium sp. GPGPB12 TaxID=3023517 RepID=UPI003134266D